MSTTPLSTGRHPRGAAILAVALLLATLGSGATSMQAAAATADAPAFGVQWHATWGSETDASRAKELDTMQASNVGWVRIDVGWAMLQPKPGSYDTNWAVPFVEKQIDAARARGLNVLVTFWRTPDWANGGRGPLVPPADPRVYGEALAHFVKLWKGKVQAWEVWNEPNAKEFFAGADPAQYAALLKAGYTAAKAADPDAKIVFGGTMYVDTTWIRQVYDAGAKDYFDIMAVHPYMGMADAAPESADTGDPWTMMHVDTLVTLMRNRGHGDMPIWFTEFGWSVHENTAATPPWSRGVTEMQQADYLKRSVALTQARWPQVDVMIWYNSRDKQTGNEHQDGYGVMRRDFSPRPVLRAASQLPNATTTPPPPPVPTPTPAPNPTPTPPATPPSTTPTPEPDPEPQPEAEPDPEAPPQETLIEPGAPWKFTDSATLPEDRERNRTPNKRDWRSPKFDAGSWQHGPARLGYGDRRVSTQLRSGRETYVFRRAFKLNEPNRTKWLRLQVVRDDGVAVWLNGRRVFTNNLPQGAVTLRTKARRQIDGAAEKRWVSAWVPSKWARQGKNIVVVSVHNAPQGSGDVRFDLSLGRRG